VVDDQNVIQSTVNRLEKGAAVAEVDGRR
jgi:hypothetical protein